MYFIFFYRDEFFSSYIFRMILTIGILANCIQFYYFVPHVFRDFISESFKYNEKKKTTHKEKTETDKIVENGQFS